MHPTLLLFDVDGTLIWGSRAGRRAMEQAFLSIYGREDATRGIDYRGKPDPLIFAEILERLGLDPADARSPHLWEAYLNRLREEFPRDPGHMVPGARAFVRRVAASPAFRLAVGTGNLAEATRIKLAAHGLDGYFPTGGYGSDSDRRSELVRRGIERARSHYGVDFARVIVVGDTPRDIACARENGAQVLAVAGGGHTLDELARHQPDWLFPDFTPLEEILSRLA